MIPVASPLYVGKEKQYLLECIESGWLSGEGPYVKRFEEAFAHWLGVESAATVCNGSFALDIAFAALRLEPGSEVILPSFTIISCAAAIVRGGLVPVCVDCDPVTFNMTPEGIRRAITTKTKAILLVHTYGLPAHAEEIVAIAQSHNLIIVEDCAEIVGQTYKGRLCGTFGDIATFSFYANKHISTGEGGMVTTNNRIYGERVRALKNFVFGKGSHRFHHEDLGWNCRMGNMQAAVGLAQLEMLDSHLIRKREVGGRYNSLFEGVKGIQLPLAKTDYATNIYWVYPIVLNESVGFDAHTAIARCEGVGVMCRPLFFGMHEQPVFRKRDMFKGVSLPTTERLSRRGFYIPMGPNITEAEQAHVAQTIRSLIE